jgi:hypothetical protein
MMTSRRSPWEAPPGERANGKEGRKEKSETHVNNVNILLLLPLGQPSPRRPAQHQPVREQAQQHALRQAHEPFALDDEAGAADVEVKA